MKLSIDPELNPQKEDDGFPDLTQAELTPVEAAPAADEDPANTQTVLAAVLAKDGEELKFTGTRLSLQFRTSDPNRKGEAAYVFGCPRLLVDGEPSGLPIQRGTITFDLDDFMFVKLELAANMPPSGPAVVDLERKIATASSYSP